MRILKRASLGSALLVVMLLLVAASAAADPVTDLVWGIVNCFPDCLGAQGGCGSG